MGVIETVRNRLISNHPDLRFTESDSMIAVQSPVNGGFNISITSDLVVWFDGWHEHFDDESEALDCFAFGFSDQCRLKVTLRGKFDYRWALQVIRDGEWVTESTTGLLIFPFWRAKRVEYRSNAGYQKTSL